jgi:hypothetical protein
MIRYRYVTHLQPPAPFVNVTVRCPTTGTSVKDIPAQIDPAADRTVVPGGSASPRQARESVFHNKYRLFVVPKNGVHLRPWLLSVVP